MVMLQYVSSVATLGFMEQASQIYKTVGAHLRFERELRRWSTRDLAGRLTGYQNYDVSKWEADARPIPVQALHEIASAFAKHPAGTLRGYTRHVGRLVRLSASTFPRTSRREAVAA